MERKRGPFEQGYEAEAFTGTQAATSRIFLSTATTTAKQQSIREFVSFGIPESGKTSSIDMTRAAQTISFALLASSVRMCPVHFPYLTTIGIPPTRPAAAHRLSTYSLDFTNEDSSRNHPSDTVLGSSLAGSLPSRKAGIGSLNIQRHESRAYRADGTDRNSKERPRHAKSGLGLKLAK